MPGTSARTTPAAPAPMAVPSVSAALDLGWRMEQLYRALPERPARARQPQARLGGFSDLNQVQKFQRRLEELEFALTATCNAVVWSAVVTQPSTAAVRTALVPFLAATQGSKTAGVRRAQATNTRSPTIAATLREAVNTLHEETLIKLSGADARLGTAYGLGRALADTMRSTGNAEDLKHNFAPYRLGQLYASLTDLASALPPHAAKSVAQSLAWWRDTLYVTNAELLGQNRQIMNGIRTDAPNLLPSRGRNLVTRALATLRPASRNHVRISEKTHLTAARPGASTAFNSEVMQRQGEIWRGVLTGEKHATDLLTATDYVAAARDTLTMFWRLISRTRGLIVPAALLSIGFFAVIAAIVYTSASGGSKIGGVLGASVTYLVATGKALGPRVSSLAQDIETPLMGDALDRAIAYAITLPPAGTADPSGWLRFSHHSSGGDGSGSPMATTTGGADTAR